MQSILKHWELRDKIAPEADQSLTEFPPLLRQLLYNRGHSTKETALDYILARPAHDTNPLHIHGIPEAASRLARAIAHQEQIAVYGDYDVDGVTATALLVQFLKSVGANVIGYIPNRFEEGYGLNNDALDQLKLANVSLVVTVDCGIRSLEEAEHASEIGLDLIISDHHHPGSSVPSAVAVINPKQETDQYPEKDLSGVGLAYKLADAVLTTLRNSGNAYAEAVEPINSLDLVALGTVADLAPLTGENRTLVREGLKLIRNPRRQGLMALIGVSGISPARITAEDIGFILGPRLNAAGRLDSALAAFDLLISQEIAKTGLLAQQLDSQNRERQRITREILEAAETIAIGDDPDAWLLFAAHESFNPGVVGLAASRLTDKYYRPAVIAHRGEDFTRGSCRSIPEFHITEALDRCGELLEHHGGHAAAAGFTIKNENLPDFVERLKQIAADQLSPIDLRPRIIADQELSFSEIGPDILPYLEMLQPTGNGNPKAVFVTRDLRVVNSRPVGKDYAHMKLVLSDGWITYDAIAFRQGHWYGNLPQRIDVMYTYEVNEYNGRESLQLNIRDLKPAGSAD
jgi:single-stranded-DNA-specific exonuclease